MLALCANPRIDSWKARVKLYDSTVLATLLYAAPAWALRYADKLEKVQLEFFKRLLRLPRSTPSASLRLELGLLKVDLKILRLTYNYVIKVLSMEPTRLPRICLISQIDQFRNQPTCNRLLWISQLEPYLARIGMVHLLSSTDPSVWSQAADSVFERYNRYLQLTDLISHARSQFLLTVIPRVLSESCAPYLMHRSPLFVLQIYAQLRLMNTYQTRFYWKGSAYVLDHNAICSICNLREPESIAHFFFVCPLYKHFRQLFISPILSQNYFCIDNLLFILLQADQKIIKSIVYYVTNCLRIRAFCLNE